MDAFRIQKISGVSVELQICTSASYFHNSIGVSFAYAATLLLVRSVPNNEGHRWPPCQ